MLRTSSAFAYHIPEGLDSASAAPLLCAGVTVYSPLRKYVTRPGMKVAVIGIGGLGHLALQFAAAMGAEVRDSNIKLQTFPMHELQSRAVSRHCVITCVALYELFHHFRNQ